ncbi:MAG: flippase-like domain-containing protein [Thermomicrobium sp.]|nr:flippase-like domain-containing protein [Thermomicrobium sp.]
MAGVRARSLPARWRPLAGVLPLAAVVWRLGPDELLAASTGMSLVLLLLATLLATVPPLCYAWRWQRLLAVADAPVSLPEAVRVTVASSAANYLVPAFGWAPAKVLATRRWLGIGVRRTLPTLVVEQALDLGALLGLAVVGLAGSPLERLRSASAPLVRPLPLLALGFTVAFVLLALVLSFSERARRWGRDRGVVGLRAVRDFARDPAVWLATLGRWGAELALVALLVEGAGARLGWRDLCVLLSAPSLVGLLSPIPGGLGVREAAGVLLARWAGWDPVTIGAALAWQRIVALAGLGLVGLASDMVRRGRT